MCDIDWSVRRAMGADAGRCVTAADCYRAVQCGRACHAHARVRCPSGSTVRLAHGVILRGDSTTGGILPRCDFYGGAI